MINFKTSLLTTVFLCSMSVLAPSTSAEWVRGEGGWIYGRNVTKLEACEKAENLAKQDAIRQVVGEVIKGEDNLNCLEHNNKTQCELNQFTWTMIDGYVLAVKDKHEMDGPRPGDYRKCTVELKADVAVPKKQSDGNFGIRAKLNQANYLEGDNFHLEVETTIPSYMLIFQWLPYNDNDENVVQIFPMMGNLTIGYDNLGNYKYNIPNISKGIYYKANFSKHLKGKKNIEDNYLIAIVTKKPVVFLSKYTRDSFATKLHKMGSDSYRIVKLQYNVVSK